MTSDPTDPERSGSEPPAGLFRDIVESSPIGFYTIQDDRFLYVNRGLAEMLGVTTDALLELPSVMDIVLEEDRARVREQMKGRLEREEDVAHYFFRMRHASGRSLHIELYGTRVEVDGRPALAGTVLDVTARLRAEAAREKLIDELQQALDSVRKLSDVVPICAWCRQIRDDDGYWSKVETFIESHTGAMFTHGMCPDCQARMEEEASGARE